MTDSLRERVLKGRFCGAGITDARGQQEQLFKFADPYYKEKITPEKRIILTDNPDVIPRLERILSGIQPEEKYISEWWRLHTMWGGNYRFMYLAHDETVGKELSIVTRESMQGGLPIFNAIYTITELREVLEKTKKK